MPLLLETNGHVATLTLSRPQARNAWDEDYNEGLRTLLPQFETDDGARCLILDRG